MRTRKQFLSVIAIAIIAIIALPLAGCKSDEPTDQPQPVAQSKTLEGIKNNNDEPIVNVTINYTALPNTTLSYMSTLEKVIIGSIKGVPATGNLTINIISSSSDGFVLAGSKGSKTLNVRDTWLANATEQEMGISLGGVIVDWIAGYSTPRSLSFGTEENPCTVTITSDDQFVYFGLKDPAVR
jgi:hypothetical protein